MMNKDLRVKSKKNKQTQVAEPEFFIFLYSQTSQKKRMQTEEKATRTIVEVPKWTKTMEKSQRFVLLGSCFAGYMGERFKAEGMDAVCNPLGAAYNPESIAIQVRTALESDKMKSLKDEKKESSLLHSFNSSIFYFDGLWRCWWANTRITGTDREQFRVNLADTFSLLGSAIRKADWLFLTLGTSVCYRLKENGMIVANCHKVPSRSFEEIWLDVDTCMETLCSLTEQLTRECPGLRVVLTVSPYRYRKYGLHGSQLAKATLLLAIDRLCKRFPEKVVYFPAYEIMLDELRNYNFYADDMIHPAPEAVEHIWNRFWNR